MVNGEVCVGLFAIRDIKKVMISAESGEPFMWPRSSCITVCVCVLKSVGGTC